MALLETSLLFQNSVVRIRATAGGVILRAQLSTSGPPLRLEIEDGRDGGKKKKPFKLVATIRAGRDAETPLASRRIPLLIQSVGVVSVRLDQLLSELVGNGSNENHEMIGPMAEQRIFDGLEFGAPSFDTFDVLVLFTPCRTDKTNRLFTLPTATIRAEGVDFPFTRELLCLHSEFFCALFYGSFAESGKDFVKLESVTSEGLNILYGIIQRRKPIEIETAVTALAMTDRFLIPSLKAKISALPIPADEEQKKRWLLDADKYNAFGLAERIVLTIPQKDANAVHVQLFDELSNKEVHKFLVLRSSRDLKPPALLSNNTVMALNMGHFGGVHVRLFTDEMPEETFLELKNLPASTTWLPSGNGFKADVCLHARKTTIEKRRLERKSWTLCSIASDLWQSHLWLIKDCSYSYYYVLGEVVHGVEVLDRSMYNVSSIKGSIRIIYN